MTIFQKTKMALACSGLSEAEPNRIALTLEASFFAGFEFADGMRV